MANDNDKSKWTDKFKIHKGKSISRDRGGGEVDEIPKDSEGKGDYGKFAENIKAKNQGKTFAEKVRSQKENTNIPKSAYNGVLVPGLSLLLVPVLSV